MVNPYHYEDEALGMDLLLPAEDNPYAFYSHSPLHHEHDYLHHDPAHSMDHQESKKDNLKEDNEYTEFTRYYNNSEQQMKD